MAHNVRGISARRYEYRMQPVEDDENNPTQPIPSAPEAAPSRKRKGTASGPSTFDAQYCSGQTTSKRRRRQ